MAVFTPDSFCAFCQEYPERRPLLELFDPEDDLYAMVAKVADYSRERGLMKALLERALRSTAIAPAVRPKADAPSRIGPALGTPDPPPAPAPSQPMAPAGKPPLESEVHVPGPKLLTIECHGRVSYQSPMDLEYAYPLRVAPFSLWTPSSMYTS